MNGKRLGKILLGAASVALLTMGTAALAAAPAAAGLSGVASQVISNFGGVAKLITAGSYIAGMGFGVGSIVKFKAHKDNPTQVPIGQAIALLFVSAALLFIPSVFQSTGITLFGGSGYTSSISGVTGFGVKNKPTQ